MEKLQKLMALLGSACVIAGCTSAPTFTGSSFFGRLPPCENGVKQWCEGTEVYYVNGRRHVDITEYGASADRHQPAGYSLKFYPRQYYFLWCGLEEREAEPIRCRSNRFEEIHNAKSFSDIQYCFAPPSDECRRARDYARQERYTVRRQRLNDNRIAAKKKTSSVSVSKAMRGEKSSTDITDNLKTCDSLGYERGTQAHADCAMTLYMNEQGKGSTATPANTARQQAIALARQQEQQRVRKLEESLRGIQIGLEIMSGKSSASTQSKTYTKSYNINGQIISCTTTGSITTCI